MRQNEIVYTFSFCLIPFCRPFNRVIKPSEMTEIGHLNNTCSLIMALLLAVITIQNPILF